MTENEQHNESKNSQKPWTWITGAVLLLGMAVIAGFYWSSTMNIKKVTFSGHQFTSVEELERIEVPTGIHPDSVDFGSIRNRFEKLDYVKQADISIQPNGDININVREREPIALLINGSRKMYVDAEGIPLPIVAGKLVDVPLLYGFQANSSQDTLKSKAFNTIAQFLTQVKANPVVDATISEVAWTSTNEGVVALTNDNGVKLIFGSGEFEKRLRNWEAFYAEIIKQKGIEQMRSIDLRFQGQIVTRER